MEIIVQNRPVKNVETNCMKIGVNQIKETEVAVPAVVKRLLVLVAVANSQIVPRALVRIVRPPLPSKTSRYKNTYEYNDQISMRMRKNDENA